MNIRPLTYISYRWTPLRECKAAHRLGWMPVTDRSYGLTLNEVPGGYAANLGWICPTCPPDQPMGDEVPR
jgi:hypothetical protein